MKIKRITKQQSCTYDYKCLLCIFVFYIHLNMKSTALARKLKFSAVCYLFLLFLVLSCVLGIVVQPFQLKKKKEKDHVICLRISFLPQASFDCSDLQSNGSNYKSSPFTPSSHYQELAHHEVINPSSCFLEETESK